MSRRKEHPRRPGEHSALENGWVGPTLQDQIRDKGAELWDEGKTGRAEGMAIALAILRGTKAKDELLRIKGGRHD